TTATLPRIENRSEALMGATHTVAARKKHLGATRSSRRWSGCHTALCVGFLALASTSCHSRGAASAPPPETREQCVARLSAFEDSVTKLPDRTVAAVAG